jgi:PhnB protein
MNLNIYLTFDGNCEEAMNFYSKVFSVPIDFIQHYGEAPMESDEVNKDKVMHASMNIDGVALMASDGMDEHKPAFGNNISISVNCNSEAEVDKGFNGISEGGTITMPLQDTFWGARFGMCTDKFGVHWMFNYDRPQAANAQ